MDKSKLETETRSKYTIGFNAAEIALVSDAAHEVGTPRARFIREAALALAVRLSGGLTPVDWYQDAPWVEHAYNRHLTAFVRHMRLQSRARAVLAVVRDVPEGSCVVPSESTIEVELSGRKGKLFWADERSPHGYRSHGWYDTTETDPMTWVDKLYNVYVLETKQHNKIDEYDYMADDLAFDAWRETR